ncbi:MAG: alanyl-tRNA synthetase [Thermoproteota archaeon]|nr:alanyl-tRNA synthetase [Thermoproteota archaeon]
MCDNLLIGSLFQVLFHLRSLLFTRGIRLEFPETEYKIPFFIENHFVRRKCRVCGSYFWTQDEALDNCGDAPCQEYTFIGNPPTSRCFSLEEVREAFLSFFESRKHTRIKPYPVVARWRDDLFVTIASIADFQPFVTDGIIPPPANPLVISQPCLRFTDIDNVGLTAGRHFTIFEMGGAHAFNYPDKQIYWKDETVRLHHEFITNVLGVKSDRVTYKEGVWVGGGNAGPDVEPCVNGLEVSTLVFMQYKVVDSKFVDMPMKIVDTGYGMERYTWLSQGSPSCFQAVYGRLLDKIFGLAGLTNVDNRLLIESAKYSALMNVESNSDRMVLRRRVADRLGMNPLELDMVMVPVESAYAVADHTKALVFLLAEGVVPSNVKAGYLTRLLIRRTYRLLRALGIEDTLLDIVEMQIERWSRDFPNIKDMQREIVEALSVEEKKYQSTLARGIELSTKIARDLKGKGISEIPMDTLVELYDSHGIPPEIVQEAVKAEALKVLIPDNFYTVVAQNHISPPLQKEDAVASELVRETLPFPETRMLYYEDSNISEFKAKIQGVLDRKHVILSETAFYPEGGGQDDDRGTLLTNGVKVDVVRVQKIGKVIVHTVAGGSLCEGDEVIGRVDWERRLSLMRHHTSTHVLMGAVRRVLGEHVWQVGAQKEASKSRLDISHWERITPNQLNEIEKLANSIVMSDLPVKVSWMPRDEAEKAYGYRLYQGGVVPGEKIRVVNVDEWDVEACGGTHLEVTGKIGIIKVLHTERIQDGVERIVFAAGFPALEYLQETELNLRRIAEVTNVPIDGVVKAVEETVLDLKKSRREADRLKETLAKYEVNQMLNEAKQIDGLILIVKVDERLDGDYMIKMASLLTAKDPRCVVAICGVNERVQVVVMAGEEAVKRSVHAGKIASEVARILGGGGSGRSNFGQGGGVKVKMVMEALGIVEAVVKKQLIGGES